MKSEKFQHDGESPIVLKHLSKVGLYEIRRDGGMLRQSDRPTSRGSPVSWTRRFLKLMSGCQRVGVHTPTGGSMSGIEIQVL